ncbi:MAG: rhamnan synthesis F family protein [Candidatus Gastranaerophilaceae bacterium]
MANDSCFGPFYPLRKFLEMEKKDCDFWGITKNNFGYRKVPNHFFVRRPHIQSYFIVLKNNTFKSDDFTNFMKSIKPENSKCVVVSNYEIGLSEMLVEMGFRYDVYIDAYERINNMTIYKWRQLILKYKMPFMKCSLPRLVNKNLTTIERYQEIIKQVSDYPVELIENNVKRTQYIRKGRHTSPLIVKRIFFDFLAELPFVPRKILIFLLRKCFPFIRD